MVRRWLLSALNLGTIQLAIHALSYFDQTSLTMDYTSLPNLLCYVSGGSNLVRRGSCDSSSDSEHVSGAETYVSFTGGPHKHSNPDIVKGVSFEINT